MKKSAFLFFFAIISYELPGQYIYLKGIYNYFNMSKMEKLQDDLMSDFKAAGLPIKAAESFPAKLGWQAGYLSDFPSDSIFSWGVFFDYAGTRGRIHYQDYSGEIKIDQVANAYSLGSFLSVRIKQWEFTRLNFVISDRLIFSTLTNKFFTQLGNDKDSEEIKFNSTSLGIEPGINYSFFMNLFNINLSISYLLNSPADLIFSGNDQAYLATQAGERVSLDWGGLKLGISVDYRISI